MEDLKAIFNGGVAFALFAIGGWLCLLLLIGLIRMLAGGFVRLVRLKNTLTRENPYIAAHKKLLIEREQYNEYMNVARKDGFEVAAEENENKVAAPNKIKKKKKKKE